MKQRYSLSRVVFMSALSVVLQVVAVAQFMGRLVVQKHEYQYPGWALGVGAAVWIALAARAVLRIYRFKEVRSSNVLATVSVAAGLLMLVVSVGFPLSRLDAASTLIACSLAILIALQDHVRWYVSAQPYDG